ncbi:MAG: ATP/GTP-binding protein [Candidatus Bathyarchaeia archaeon]
MVLGTAGSGKSMLIGAFSTWLSRSGLANKIVNLDPGAEELSYTPDCDLREIISAREIMRIEGLGPNGAMIRAAFLILEKVSWLKERILKLSDPSSDVILVDTPGQMELFVFQPSGPAILSELSSLSRAVGVFLLDPQLTSSPANLAAALVQAVITRVRLDIPLVIAVSKSDLKLREDLDKLISQPTYLRERINVEELGSSKGIALSLVDLIDEIPWVQQVVRVSSVTGEGFSNLYGLVHEVFCSCGDLT